MADLGLDTPISTGSRRRTREDVEELVERYFSEFELPSPEALAQYEKISPGAAQKIIELRVLREQHARELAETTEAHRRLAVLMAYFAIIFIGIVLSLLSFVFRGSDSIQVIATIAPAIVGILTGIAFRANRKSNG